ncbi:MAG: hypothetical protein HYX32_01365 [Actinobacteria bacterium]|nr:hypothetical protein [Actinomycetota bacterium]
MTAEWFAGLSPAHAAVECGDAIHHLEWRDGSLTAADHEDAEGDRTLAALGGDRHTCLAVLDAWARHEHDLRVLVLASRGPSDAVRVPDEMRMAAGGRAAGGRAAGGRATGWFSYGAAGTAMAASMPRQARLTAGMSQSFAAQAVAGARGRSSDPDDVAGAMQLLGLGGGLPRRLCAHVAAHWGARLAEGDDEASRRRAELHAALHGRVVCAVREWLDDAAVPVHVDMIEPGDDATVRREHGGLHVSVPFRWILDVWAPGLGVVAGAFTLRATRDGAQIDVHGVSPDLSDRHMELSPSAVE